MLKLLCPGSQSGKKSFVLICWQGPKSANMMSFSKGEDNTLFIFIFGATGQSKRCVSADVFSGNTADEVVIQKFGNGSVCFVEV